MRLRRRDAVLFVCGSMTDYGHEAFTQLAEQAPRWMDVYLVGYRADRPGLRESVLVGGREYVHEFYDARDLTDFDFPTKTAVDPAEFSLMPGNTDLIGLRFVRDHPGYRRYWSIEDDVRFGGDWASLFGHFRRSRAALLGTTIRRRPDDPKWHWWRDFAAPSGAKLPPAADQLASFLPFVAVTPRAVRAITRAYRAGWTGHYEALWPTVVRLAGLPVRDIGGNGEFVAAGDEHRFYVNTGKRHMAPGTFVWRPTHNDFDRDSGQLWHPVRVLAEGGEE